MSSPKHLSRILIVDIESTCWRRGNPPEGQRSDIIEIGVTPVAMPNMSIGEPQHIYVKPANSTVSGFCEDLTGITQDTLDTEGVSLEEACTWLREEFGSKKSTWVSWGNYDRRQFRVQTYDYKVDYPFGLDHINIKTLFSLVRGETKSYGVLQALSEIGEEFEGDHHSGLWDSYNIANLFIWTMGVFKTGMTKRKMDAIKARHKK